jgi:hypothetical protein
MAESKPESPAEQFDSILKSTKKKLISIKLILNSYREGKC